MDLKGHTHKLIDIVWPISQSFFHISCLCLLKKNYSLSFLCNVYNYSISPRAHGVA